MSCFRLCSKNSSKHLGSMECSIKADDFDKPNLNQQQLFLFIVWTLLLCERLSYRHLIKTVQSSVARCSSKKGKMLTYICSLIKSRDDTCSLVNGSFKENEQTSKILRAVSCKLDTVWTAKANLVASTSRGIYAIMAQVLELSEPYIY